VPVLFTEAARFRSWFDVAAALAELTIIPAEMPDSSIHGMRIDLCFRRSLISASGQLRAIPATEVPARSDPAANPAAIGSRAPEAVDFGRDHARLYGQPLKALRNCRSGR